VAPILPIFAGSLLYFDVDSRSPCPTAAFTIAGVQVGGTCLAMVGSETVTRRAGGIETSGWRPSVRGGSERHEIDLAHNSLKPRSLAAVHAWLR